MKNKKLVAIIITAALTLTACQSSKANIGTSTEVPGDSTSAEETTVLTSSVETSKVSTEENRGETLSNEDKRRIELFKRAFFSFSISSFVYPTHSPSAIYFTLLSSALPEPASCTLPLSSHYL